MEKVAFRCLIILHTKKIVELFFTVIQVQHILLLECKLKNVMLYSAVSKNVVTLAPIETYITQITLHKYPHKISLENVNWLIDAYVLMIIMFPSQLCENEHVIWVLIYQNLNDIIVWNNTSITHLTRLLEAEFKYWKYSLSHNKTKITTTLFHYWSSCLKISMNK